MHFGAAARTPTHFPAAPRALLEHKSRAHAPAARSPPCWPPARRSSARSQPASACPVHARSAVARVFERSPKRCACPTRPHSAPPYAPGSPRYGRRVEHGLAAGPVPWRARAMVDCARQGSCSAAGVPVPTQAARARVRVRLRRCDLSLQLYGAVALGHGAHRRRAARPRPPRRPLHRAGPVTAAPERPGAARRATCAFTCSQSAPPGALCAVCSSPRAATGRAGSHPRSGALTRALWVQILTRSTGSACGTRWRLWIM